MNTAGLIAYSPNDKYKADRKQKRFFKPSLGNWCSLAAGSTASCAAIAMGIRHNSCTLQLVQVGDVMDIRPPSRRCPGSHTQVTHLLHLTNQPKAHLQQNPCSCQVRLAERGSQDQLMQAGDSDAQTGH